MALIATRHLLMISGMGRGMGGVAVVAGEISGILSRFIQARILHDTKLARNIVGPQ